MANNSQIDEISLGIRVEDRDSATKISAVASAINKLRKSLASLKDVSEQMRSMQDMFASLSKIKLNNAKQKNEGSLKGGAGLLKKINVDEDLSMASTEAATQSMAGYNAEVRSTATSLEEYRREQNKVNDSQNEGARSTGKLADKFKKFTRAIGRVAFYRAIRTAIKEIVQGAKEGLANIRTEDSELNDAMNRLSQSATTLKNSFAQLLAPIIKTIEPIITKIADSIATIVNRIEEAKAALSGQDTYTKILTSDTEEYQEAIKKAGEESKKQQGNLLSFDTFTTQSARKNNSTYTGVITEKVKMTKKEALKILDTIDAIKVALISIATIIATIKITSIIKSVKELTTLLGSPASKLGVLGSLLAIVTIVTGLVNTIKGIKNILNWNEFTSGAQKFADVLTVILGIVATIAGLIGLLTGNLALVGYAAIAATGAIVASSISREEKAKSVGVSNYAAGGNFDKGDLFVANENNKTELVASTNNGGSVMNLEQWESISYSSFYRALSDYDAAQNGRGGEFDLNSLGRTIAGNSGFVNEINRRNSSLNLI